ncbi:MAG: zinc ABC transporter substrate-binding protein [Eubacterium sp.]|nr:zinc ABC transporter substrate-binding protein [Eubacterium sp.]
MRNSKKILSILLCACLILCLALVSACSKSENGKTPNNGTDKLSIVCTIFPEYDWVKQILGDKFSDCNLTLLLDNGVDLHNYPPTATDIITISTCDMFIYVGGESDDWVDGVLASANNDKVTVINLLQVLGRDAKEEEMLEGMEGEEEEDKGVEYDEHIWFSLKNAQTLCRYICERISEIDSANSGTYSQNTEKYIEKLNALDEEYQSAVDSSEKKVLLFGDRFPFRYMADDYGLTCFAAFSGCSAETEASFETISFLAGKVDEFNLHTVLTIEGSHSQIAQTIIASTTEKNQQILSLDSMQSTTSKDIENGADYLSIMQNNLEILKQALA